MPEVRYIDAAGAVRAWVNARPGLCGKGNPLTNGVHLGEVRSSSSGPVASVQEIAPSEADEAVHDARVSFEVRSVGSEAGARADGERAARALANAITVGLRGNPATVVLPSGDTVRILCAHSPSGPILSGVIGGEIRYRFDVTFRCQPG